MRDRGGPLALGVGREGEILTLCLCGFMLGKLYPQTLKGFGESSGAASPAADLTDGSQ